MRLSFKRFLLLLALAVLPIASAAQSFAQGSPALLNKTAEADKVIAKANRPEGVRVIVTLRSATAGPASAPMPSASTSASTQQPSAAATSGPLGDGQAATVEQAAIIATHLAA